MTSPATANAVRRSPLRVRHAALGARWVSPLAEWPAQYSDAQREHDAVRTRAALCEWGPLDKLRLSAAASGASVVPFALGRISVGAIAGRRAELWGLAGDDALLLVPAASGDAAAGLREVRAAADPTATDVSSHFCALRLVGPRSRDVLGEVYPEDVSDRALPDRHVSFGPLANTPVILGRCDIGVTLGFTILVERDLAEYMWDALLAIGARHELTPAGVVALADR